MSNLTKEYFTQQLKGLEERSKTHTGREVAGSEGRLKAYTEHKATALEGRLKAHTEQEVANLARMVSNRFDDVEMISKPHFCCNL